MAIIVVSMIMIVPVIMIAIIIMPVVWAPGIPVGWIISPIPRRSPSHIGRGIHVGYYRPGLHLYDYCFLNYNSFTC
jgi:hypothetical protein